MKQEDELQKKKLKKIRIIIQLIIIIVLVIITIIACIKLFPIFVRIQNDEVYRQYIIEKINSYGNFSWLILILFSIIQTIFAIIPAGPVVMISGMMYSPWIAIVICLAGQTLGALCVYLLVKAFGYKFIALFIDPEQHKKFKLLDDPKRCGVLMFSYLLIPFLPKDPIAFIAPFTKVRLLPFLTINLVARTPMTIVTVLFGNAVINSNFSISIIMGVVCTIVALICIIFNKQIVQLIDKLISRIKPHKNI